MKNIVSMLNQKNFPGPGRIFPGPDRIFPGPGRNSTWTRKSPPWTRKVTYGKFDLAQSLIFSGRGRIFRTSSRISVRGGV